MCQQIDPRGQQFAAAVTSAVLVAVLLTAPGPVAVALLAVQAALFATAVVRGVQRTPVAALFRTVVRPRLGAADPPRGRRAAALRPGRRAGVRAGRPRRLPRRRRTSWGTSPPAFALVAALLNATIGLCLGCEAYLLGRRAHGAARPHHHPDPRTNRNQEHHMSRENTLVSAQWVEDNLDNDDIVLVEVDEDTSAYDKGHIKGAIKLDWTTDLQDQVRRDFVDKDQFEALLSAKGVGNDDTDRALRRQQQLVRGLRLLVLQALRPRGRQAARRRPQEVGARQPRAHRRGHQPRRDVVHRPGPEHRASARSATRSSRPSA